MESAEKKQARKKIIIWASVYALLLLGTLTVINLEAVNAWFASLLRLLRPILIGLALAYLCNPIFRFFERRVFGKLRVLGLRRTLSLILTYITVLLVLALILLLILPQLLQSIAAFVGDYQKHLDAAITQINSWITSINGFCGKLTGSPELIAPIDPEGYHTSIADWWEENSETLLGYFSASNFKPITEVLGNAVSVLTDSLFGFFISLYLLSTKEKRYAQVMKLRRALFGNTVNRRITLICKAADRSFGAFLEGKLFDSLIVGLLTYTSISIFKIPYAVIIASIIGVLNIIPYIGLYIGAVPAALILLFSAPGKLIPFLLIIVVIQQIDANIISPKILGSNTGVSSMCVVIAVATMGTLWGLIGMILSVPLFATVLTYVESRTIEHLQKKGRPSGLESYYPADSLFDPSKTAYSTTDKTAQKLERAALHIDKKQRVGDKLTKRDQLVRFISSVAHKYHIINELSDETETRFSTIDAQNQCMRESAELLRQYREAAEPSAPAADARTE